MRRDGRTAPHETEMTQPATSAHVPEILAAGTAAPDFALHATPDQILRLSELRGRPVILVFYPADWSPVCGDQVALYNEILPEFHEYGAEIVGISVDGVWCHAAFARDRHLHFPLLADFEPKGAVSRLYGAYRADEGISERALFVLDGDGIIRWSYCSPIGVNPGADGILSALESLGPKSAPGKAESFRSDTAEARP
jgi:peroxiredoxin